MNINITNKTKLKTQKKVKIESILSTLTLKNTVTLSGTNSEILKQKITYSYDNLFVNDYN